MEILGSKLSKTLKAPKGISLFQASLVASQHIAPGIPNNAHSTAWRWRLNGMERCIELIKDRRPQRNGTEVSTNSTLILLVLQTSSNSLPCQRIYPISWDKFNQPHRLDRARTPKKTLHVLNLLQMRTCSLKHSHQGSNIQY